MRLVGHLPPLYGVTPAVQAGDATLAWEALHHGEEANALQDGNIANLQRWLRSS